MKVSILTSGFPNGFTEDFAKCIKEYYRGGGSFVFIASDFSDHIKNDKYSNIFLNMFINNSIVFNKAYTIDNRISEAKAIEFIEGADVIWISGGDTLKQIEHMRKYNIIPALKKREGITVGMSAGSINMAKKVVIAKDLRENILELTIYDGIGLVDINIEPHLDITDEEHMKDIYEASRYTRIYGLCDEGFIKVVENSLEIYGTCYKYENVD